ncbi:hexokinase-domain-containing protein [Mycena alexandri]|uniref:Phosphotransferase n=1 Tax=Mycena alexandri TaxID=1745969 RepID=A0AAD6T051_9AGAR|nr:hexokinase-domain-containing protein [Mycena alexandri]
MFTTNISPPAQKELDRIAALYEVSEAQLKKITDGFGDAFTKGLQVEHQAVTMGPSWVTHSPDGTEKGTSLTLEIGWDSVHVASVELDGKRSFTTQSKNFEIKHELLFGGLDFLAKNRTEPDIGNTNAEATVFFDFLARCVGDFLKERSNKSTVDLRLGFNFGFGVEKSSIDHGKLLSWSKGFSISGAVGQDVVELLQKAFDRAKLSVKCTALINDSVAVLLAQSYLEAPCVLSAIYGAGTNGSYLESGASIKKLPGFRGTSMMINTEWGMFNDLTSWFYLGQIARQIFLSLVEKGLMFNGVATDSLKNHTFSSFHLFQIEDAKDYGTIKEVLCESFGYSEDAVSTQDAEIAKTIATIIAVRGGKLAACPIASLLTRQGYASGLGQGPIRIAVDGELFIGSAQFEIRLKQGIATILGHCFENKLDFHHVQGKGHVGAAIACFEAQHVH